MIYYFGKFIYVFYVTSNKESSFDYGSWDGNTKTVSIYTLSSDASYIDTTVQESTDYVPYSTTDPSHPTTGYFEW